MTDEKLLKLLALTQSENDHEALVALRMAQSYMKKKNISWTSTHQERQFSGDELQHVVDRYDALVQKYNALVDEYNGLLLRRASVNVEVTPDIVSRIISQMFRR